jgi:hypothetical protein
LIFHHSSARSDSNFIFFNTKNVAINAIIIMQNIMIRSEAHIGKDSVSKIIFNYCYVFFKMKWLEGNDIFHNK